MFEDCVRWATIVCFGYLAVVYGLYLIQAVFAVVESLTRNRERHAEDFVTIEHSRFMIPVSCVVTAYNEEATVVASVRALLAQNYPQLEVLVVDDGSGDGTFERLCEAFDVEPQQVFSRAVFETEDVLSTYRSGIDARLSIVRKLNGGKADALNCGINFAAYPYIAGIDGDTVCHPDALLKTLGVVLRDSKVVVGVTSYVAFSNWPEQSARTPRGEGTVDHNLLSNFERIDFIRSFLVARLAWSRLGYMLCVSGAFQIWRRDVLEAVGGFSRDFTCEDIEMTFRVHDRYLREGRPYEIVALPYSVAITEGPNRIQALIKQRARWQRVTMETVWHYRRLIGNPRYKSVGLIGAPYFLITEVLAPFFESLSVVLILTDLWLGLLNWVEVGAALGIMALVSALLGAIALLIEDNTARGSRIGELRHFLALGLIELFAYRPILMFARGKGAWDFFRKRKDWDRSERNERTA